ARSLLHDSVRDAAPMHDDMHEVRPLSATRARGATFPVLKRARGALNLCNAAR
ncbi:hypothetical protein HAX54_020398, partial [Datura stramonium]|nr:hypothetical protein [Datura stramonium]